MAKKNEVSVWIRGKDLASSAFKGFERNLNATWKTLKGVGRSLAAFTAAATGAVFALGKLSERGDKVANVRSGFERATRGEAGALDALKRASQGVISEFELMEGHNKAYSLGATRNAAQTAQLTQRAKALSRVMGIDLSYGFESLVTGIGRLSPRWIDNLGITVDLTKAYDDYAAAQGKNAKQLTELEKKQALFNAVITEADRLIERMGGDTAAAEEGWSKLTTAIADGRDRLAEFIAKTPEVQEAFAAMVEAINTMADRLPGVIRKVAELGTTAADMFSGGGAAAVERATMSGFDRAGDQASFRDMTQRELEDWTAEMEAIRAELIARAANPDPGSAASSASRLAAGLAGMPAPRESSGGAKADPRDPAFAGLSLAQLRERLETLDQNASGTSLALERMNAALKDSETAANEAALAELRRKRDEAREAGRIAAGVDALSPSIGLSGVGDPDHAARARTARIAADRRHAAAVKAGRESGELGGMIEATPHMRRTERAAEELVKGLKDADKPLLALTDSVGDLALSAMDGRLGMRGLASSITSMIAQFAGPFGGLVSAFGGLALSRLFGGGRDRPRVVVDEYSPRAMNQRRHDRSGPRTQFILGDRELTDEEALRKLGYNLQRRERLLGGSRTGV